MVLLTSAFAAHHCSRPPISSLLWSPVDRAFDLSWRRGRGGLWFCNCCTVLVDNMDDRGGSFVAVRRISHGIERGNTCHSTSGTYFSPSLSTLSAHVFLCWLSIFAFIRFPTGYLFRFWSGSWNLIFLCCCCWLMLEHTRAALPIRRNNVLYLYVARAARLLGCVRLDWWFASFIRHLIIRPVKLKSPKTIAVFRTGSS